VGGNFRSLPKGNGIGGVNTEGMLMGIRVLFVALLAFASSANAAEEPLPSSFVNGSAKGYSIALVSASPAPGTIVGVGQTVEFKITVSYQLSVADKGSILLVVQDETNRNLLGNRKQQSQSVDRGKGTVTLTDSFVVPGGSSEVRLFIPLVPEGMTNTDGEVVVSYVVRDANAGSSIGYASVAAALKDLRSKPDVQFTVQNGWTIAEDRSHFTLWSFPPESDPAYPSAVKRTAVQEAGGRVTMDMKVLCQSTQSACDKLVADFNALNERMRDSFRKN
jgi:hypothetical protein